MNEEPTPTQQTPLNEPVQNPQPPVQPTNPLPQPVPEQPVVPAAQPAPLQAAPAQPASPVATPTPVAPQPSQVPAAPTLQPASKPKRIAMIVFGVLLVLFSLSIVQGQATHHWDIVGIIMILFFGGIGVYLLYAGLLKKQS